MCVCDGRGRSEVCIIITEVASSTLGMRAKQLLLKSSYKKIIFPKYKEILSHLEVAWLQGRMHAPHDSRSNRFKGTSDPKDESHSRPMTVTQRNI